jgi:pimeloyl-ACP methyl ester carboxylesterase
MSIVRYSLMLLVTISAASAQVPIKRERFQNAEVLYDWVTDSRGEKLRTFVTHPKNAPGKVPVIFFVGWLSCDSMEYSEGETDGFGALILRLIDRSGYATVRMDKPGVGESQGSCGKTDFNVELEGWRAAFDSMGKYDFIDTDRVFVLGMSNGGGFSPMVAQGHPVRGYLAASSWGRTWYEHMVEHERRRLTAAGKPPAEINDDVKAFAQFYDLYLNRGLTPGQAIAQHPEWKNLWYDAPDGQYGRPAGFYQQLQSLNLGRVWQQVNAPVLVVHGTGDIVMSSADSNAISETVNHVHPGTAENYVVENMNHLFMVDKKFHDPLVPEILNWINKQLAARPASLRQSDRRLATAGK